MRTTILASLLLAAAALAVPVVEPEICVHTTEGIMCYPPEKRGPAPAPAVSGVEPEICVHTTEGIMCYPPEKRA
jgi:hypothetical protein